MTHNDIPIVNDFLNWIVINYDKNVLRKYTCMHLIKLFIPKSKPLLGYSS